MFVLNLVQPQVILSSCGLANLSSVKHTISNMCCLPWKVRDTEDMKIAEASVLAALEALSNGSSPASAVIAADAAAETAEASLLGGDKDEGVDEFGRSLKLMRQSEVAARSTRRKIRWTRSRQDSRNSTFDLEASSDDSDGEVREHTIAFFFFCQVGHIASLKWTSTLRTNSHLLCIGFSCRENVFSIGAMKLSTPHQVLLLMQTLRLVH